MVDASSFKKFAKEAVFSSIDKKDIIKFQGPLYNLQIANMSELLDNKNSTLNFLNTLQTSPPPQETNGILAVERRKVAEEKEEEGD